MLVTLSEYIFFVYLLDDICLPTVLPALMSVLFVCVAQVAQR